METLLQTIKAKALGKTDSPIIPDENYPTKNDNRGQITLVISNGSGTTKQ
jgi:hypothetical protein